MTLFRAMRPHEDGFPIVASKRWGLGVRIEGRSRDVTVRDGMVGAMGGGMSVARDWRDLIDDYLPPEFGGTSKKEVLFAVEETDLPGGLIVKGAGPRKGHYEVQPRRKMPIDVYVRLLEGTRNHWRRVKP